MIGREITRRGGKPSLCLNRITAREARGSRKMMPSNNVKQRSAAQILNAALRDPGLRGSFRNVFAELFEADGGEMIPVYDAISAEGYGAVRCEFEPLAAVEKLAASCARLVDEYAAGGALPSSMSADARQRLAEQLAHYGTQALLLQFRKRLTTAVEDSFADAMFIASALLAQSQADAHDVQIDVREDVEAAVQRVAEREREMLKSLLGDRYDRLNRGAVGRPRSVTDSRVRRVLRVYGKVSKDRAAVLLGCSEKAIRDWAKSTEWKTWGKARDVLLSRLRGGRN
jgi:hypothetical protein